METVTLKSSSDSERPLGVVSGSSISNFILNWRVDCSLFGGIGLPFLRQLLEIDIVNISLIGAYR